jgi:alpha-ketoglutarate-dependent 2,4-dichlorophenoxyacetate dioxygenase
MWDDRCTMHRGTAFDDTRWRRDIQRATIADRANSCVLEGMAEPPRDAPDAEFASGVRGANG